jgi:hypothetical protein
MLILARAMVLYHLRRTAESWAHVTAAIADLKQRGTANLVMVQLQLGLGSIRSREGRYAEAACHMDEALQMAMHLGNDTHSTRAAGNLALCYNRLGRHSDQLQLVSRVPPPKGPDFAGFVEIQYAYATAISHAVLGRRSKGYDVLCALEDRLQKGIPSWIIQAWRLWKADSLMSIGRVTEAHESGREGTVDFGYKLQSIAFAGTFARWLSLTAPTLGRSIEAHEIIEDLVRRLDELDALDQVETLRALCLLERNQDASRLAGLLRNRASILPEAVLSQLAQFEGV